MGTEIDWSKAPEGATHFDRRPGVAPAFMKKDHRGWLYHYPEGCDWHYYGSMSGDIVSKLDVRPTAWTGEGLPPVGTVVHVHDYDGSLVYGHGESGAVVAHVENTAVVRMSYGMGCFSAKNLKTAEQIAADDRAEAIEKFMTVIMISRDYAGQLYDAGFRLPQK